MSKRKADDQFKAPEDKWLRIQRIIEESITQNREAMERVTDRLDAIQECIEHLQGLLLQEPLENEWEE